MMHSFDSAMVLTSSHPRKMPLKMQTNVSRENSTISQRKKECSKVIVGDTSPFIVKGWLVPRLQYKKLYSEVGNKCENEKSNIYQPILKYI